MKKLIKQILNEKKEGRIDGVTSNQLGQVIADYLNSKGINANHKGGGGFMQPKNDKPIILTDYDRVTVTSNDMYGDGSIVITIS